MFRPELVLAVSLAWKPALFATLACMAALGCLATFAPFRFRSLATASATWCDSSRFLAVLDRRFDIDQHVLRHSRLFGCLVLVSLLRLALSL